VVIGQCEILPHAECAMAVLLRLHLATGFSEPSHINLDVERKAGEVPPAKATSHPHYVSFTARIGKLGTIDQ